MFFLSDDTDIIEMWSPPGAATALQHNLGGYISLQGFYGKEDRFVSLRLYCVIAAEDVPEGTTVQSWTHPKESLYALLMGAHPRLGTASPVRCLSLDTLQHIRLFVETEVSWRPLEQSIKDLKDQCCVKLQRRRLDTDFASLRVQMC